MVCQSFVTEYAGLGLKQQTVPPSPGGWRPHGGVGRAASWGGLLPRLAGSRLLAVSTYGLPPRMSLASFSLLMRTPGLWDQGHPMTSLNPNYLSRAPSPNTVILGWGFNTTSGQWGASVRNSMESGSYEVNAHLPGAPYRRLSLHILPTTQPTPRGPFVVCIEGSDSPVCPETVVWPGCSLMLQRLEASGVHHRAHYLETEPRAQVHRTDIEVHGSGLRPQACSQSLPIPSPCCVTLSRSLSLSDPAL